MSKVNIVLGTHGNFGEELIKSAEMIVGPIKNAESVSLLADMSIEDYMGQVEKTLNQKEGPIIVLVDLFGGTPSNAFSAFIPKYNLKVITGVNFPMLIDLSLKIENSIEEPNLDELVQGCIDTLKESGVNTNRFIDAED